MFRLGPISSISSLIRATACLASLTVCVNSGAAQETSGDTSLDSSGPRSLDASSGPVAGEQAAPPVEPSAPKSESPSGESSTTSPGDASQATPVSVDLTQTAHEVMRNELEIIMQPTVGAPRVSVCTAILAGSRLDPRWAPGAYRLLAEMLAEGGYHSSAQDYAALVAGRGGEHEVSVTRDATTFCTTVPSSELPLALWVTAGRFTAGSLTPASLERAVDRLAKEFERSDSQVRTGHAPDRLRRMAFLGNYEYAHPALPNPDDLDAITIETIRSLHRESYVARRSKVAISGGFVVTDAQKEFSTQLFAARPGTSLSYPLPALIPQSTPRFSMAEDNTAKTPAAWYGWVAPPGKSRESMDLALLSIVSERRLGGSLVGSGRAAKTIDLSLDSDAEPGGYGLARLEIVGNTNQSLGTIERELEAQLKLLASENLTTDELLEAQIRLRNEQAARLETPVARARSLARGVLFGQRPEEILRPLHPGTPGTEISPDEVRAAALTLLAPRSRSTIEIYPKGWQDPWQEPMRQFHIVVKGETLGSIANQYRASVAVVTKLNNMKPTDKIYPGDKLRVPRGPATKPERELRTHTVRRGDTLSGLALKYGVTTRDIAEANGMGSKFSIQTGEALRIPWSSSKTDPSPGAVDGAASHGVTPEVSAASPTYEVRPGETLSGIAQAQGVSSVALARANGISQKAGLRVGQVLKLPPRGTGKGPAAAPVLHEVKKGDTLSGIAKKYGVNVSALTALNGITRTSTLRLGQTLKIPPKE